MGVSHSAPFSGTVRARSELCVLVSSPVLMTAGGNEPLRLSRTSLPYRNGLLQMLMGSLSTVLFFPMEIHPSSWKPQRWSFSVMDECLFLAVALHTPCVHVFLCSLFNTTAISSLCGFGCLKISHDLDISITSAPLCLDFSPWCVLLCASYFLSTKPLSLHCSLKLFLLWFILWYPDGSKYSQQWPQLHLVTPQCAFPALKKREGVAVHPFSCCSFLLACWLSFTMCKYSR